MRTVKYLEGKVLSPIHITGLVKWSIRKKLEYIQKIKDELRNTTYENIIVDKYFKKIENRLKELEKFAGNWEDFIKDARGVPYIPGSSLKGAFASAIEHYKNWKIKDKERIMAFQNIIFRDVYLRGEDLIRGNIKISKNRVLYGIEVVKPGTRFKVELIYRENNLLKLDEVFVYPTLKTLRLLYLIIKKGKAKLLPKEVIDYYNNYKSKFGEDFSGINTEEKFRFIKENGIIIRLGKYTGKLCKITLQSFEREYNTILQSKLRFIGRTTLNLLMGFVKLNIKW